MTDTTGRHELFAVCAPGAEAVCRAELVALGHADARKVTGGVEFRGSLGDAARANLWLRTANRILLRIGEFDAPGRRELASRARRLPLAPFFAPGSAVSIHVTARASALYHTGLISEVIHEAAGLESAPKGESAPQLFVRIERDRCTVSVDTSGELLHRRGYRQDVSHAPLRETLAATLLLLCRYDGREPFLDPMCGSGTIPLEAWLIATHRAPGLGRTFAFEAFPAHDIDSFREMKAAAVAQAMPPAALIQGSDVHGGALAAARHNGERAGAAEVQWERADVARRGAPAEAGLLVANPPYGKRVGSGVDRSAEDAMQALGAALGGTFARWRAGILVPSRVRMSRTSAVHELDNGGIAVKLVELAP